jgi:hypothetical protein
MKPESKFLRNGLLYKKYTHDRKCNSYKENTFWLCAVQLLEVVDFYLQIKARGNYWVFWTFSIVWYSREHDVSETGSVCVLR